MNDVPSPEEQARRILEASPLVVAPRRARLRVLELAACAVTLWAGLRAGWGWWLTTAAAAGAYLFTSYTAAAVRSAFRQGAELRAGAKAALDKAEAYSPATRPGQGEVWIVRTPDDVYGWRVKPAAGGMAEGWAITEDRAARKCVRAQQNMARRRRG